MFYDVSTSCFSASYSRIIALPLVPTRSQTQYMQSVWRDTLGFAGAKMIRRIVGISHVADLEKIEDEEIRGVCERRCLLLAREMVLGSALSLSLSLPPSQVSLNDIHQLVGRARVHYSLSPPLSWSGEMER